MKKGLVLCLTTVLIFMLALFNVDAAEYRHINNILDLSNLYYDDDINCYKSFMPISVDNEFKYTLVMSKSFAGGLFKGIIIIQNGNDQETLELLDIGNDYLVSFTSKGDNISIIEVCFDGIKNSDFMLYKGGHSDFEDKYHPYNNLDNYLSGNLVIDYDKPISKEEINSYVKATHPITKEGVAVTVVTNQYDHKLGTYKAIYLSEINNIVNIFELSINVKDFSAPIIRTKDLNYSIDNKPTIEQVITDIEVDDNVDEFKDIKIEVINDEYSSATEKGVYSIEVKAIDLSGNISTKIIKIYLNDTNAPVITGPGVLFTYTKNDPLSERFILEEMFYTHKESTITKKITLNEYNGTKTPGKYKVHIMAIDSNGNSSLKEVIIHVIANEQTTFNLDIKIITNTKNLLCENEILKEFATKAKAMGIEYGNVKVNKDVYDLNFKKAGTYKAYIEYDVEGFTNYSEVLINVNDESINKKLILLGIPLLMTICVPIYIIKRKKY